VRQRAVISQADRAQVEQARVHGFISGARCRRIHLDQEMNGRTDRVGCEGGEEKCDVCQLDDQAMAEAEQLRRLYNTKHAKESSEERLDSGIGMTSSPIPLGSSHAVASSPEHSPVGSAAGSSAIRSTSNSSPTKSSPVDRSMASSPMDSQPVMRRSKSIQPSGSSSTQSANTQGSSSPARFQGSIKRDEEIAAEMMSIIEQVEFEKQQAQRKRQQEYIQSHDQQESQEIWELE